MDHNQCERTLKQNWWASAVLDDSFMCAGGVLNQGACQGDGGSPLMCIAENQYYARGIFSWTIGCGLANIPHVYTDVVKVRSWIDQEMTANGFTTDSYTPVSYRK
ncbi:putative serine proteinase stubble-like isoform X1 [Trichophyton violaceum]|uniref:Putative serine proteinase stubble-like isoform X1 n=1 Tax=Trichophyton violaceum TaxID=34388 RepID=A0A178F6K4_TRIVO|nr:putative serine proteinase stubble-like isoform X1 [Trichophyton violaceum]